MRIKFAVYNVEWMRRLFHADGTPKRPSDPPPHGKDGERSALLAEVVKALDPDVLCIVEGPDTLKDQSKTASEQLEAWRDAFGLDGDYRAVHGFPSAGQQELCALFRESKVKVVHDPEQDKRKNPFTEPFLVDTTETLIKEHYKHYRPPLELSIRAASNQSSELGRIIVVHTKSKGIFDAVDLARFEQLSERNRKKLYAECYSIRERCNQWLDGNTKLKLVVAGDINDGLGLDYYEQRFSRSAVEVLLGTVFEPEKILRSVLPRPRLGKYGWSPSSSRYHDRITKDDFDVLIDHLLVSQSTTFEKGRVWNPYLDDAPAEVKALKATLKAASDHFPISVELEL